MTCAEAATHFGARPNTEAGCQVKHGDERMLLLRLREVEQERDELFVRLEARRHGLGAAGEDESASRYKAGSCFVYDRTPVAWRVKNDFGHWVSTTNKALADTWAITEKLAVQPLYADGFR